MICSNLSSALYTASEAAPVSRFLSFILTTAALRPDLLYSVFWTTSGSAPTIMTLPERSSCAVFIRDSLSQKKKNDKLYLGSTEVDERSCEINLQAQLVAPVFVCFGDGRSACDESFECRAQICPAADPGFK